MSATVPSAPVWVGLDLGTGGARALAVTGDGEVVGAGEAPVDSHRSQGRHEQDPDAWWQAAAAALRAAMAGLDVPVEGVAVDATSGTVVAMDSDLRPLSPGLMYDDARGAPYLDRIEAAGSELWTVLGYRRMQGSWALPKVLWLLEHVPNVRQGRILHQTDVITSRLLGRPAHTDLSSALKTGVDLRSGRWPVDVLDALGVPVGLLPEPVPCGDQIGKVSAGAAEETGLPAGTPVMAGATDGYAGQLGSGALEVGSWGVVLGTTMVFKGVTEEPVSDESGAVYSHRGPDGLWFPGGASSTGAGAVAAAFPDLGADGLAALTEQARSHDPARCVSYPLVSEGERFPFVAPDARAFTLGEPVDDAERFAALLQGVALVERLTLDSLDRLGARLDGRHVTSGGGSRNDWWTQLRADVTGRALSVPEQSGGALGMAVLAAAGGGGAAALVDAAEGMVRMRTTMEPDTERGARYAASYLRLVDALEERGWVGPDLAGHARERTTT